MDRAINESTDLLEQIKEEVDYADRRYDKGIINEEAGTSVILKDNGEISLSASETCQYKINPQTGDAVEITTASHTITNRKLISTDEVFLNKHKLNPKLYELSDMRQIFNDPTQAIGNMTMMGTVLVKAWEPSLKKYVLIRRLVRIPMFSQMLNVPDVPAGYGIDTNIASELENFKKSGKTK